jgi:hypothetical protein
MAITIITMPAIRTPGFLLYNIVQLSLKYSLLKSRIINDIIPIIA